jgi:glycine cleavage system regulatory protein
MEEFTMDTTFIVNFIGKATPATIKELTAITHENGGKWLISKVNFIEDQVAAVVKINLPKENEETVKQAFCDYKDIVVRFVDSNAALHNKHEIFSLRIDANDRAGIVNEITQVLDDQGIHIVDMDCHRVFVAGGGGVSSSLFSAQVAIQIPSQISIDDIINEIEALSEDTRVIVTT